MNYVPSSWCRNARDRSRKTCYCGGHNTNNPKRNLNNSGTKRKLEIRKAMVSAELKLQGVE